MSIPAYQEMMTPLARLLADGSDWRWVDVKDAVAEQLSISDADRQEMLPSGRQATFDNRVGWAATYLAQAGLLERPQRGVLRIADRGREALTSGATIDNTFLRQYAEFQDFKSRGRLDTESDTSDVTSTGTPEETLEAAYKTLHAELADQIAERVRSCTPRFFEQVVVKLLVAMGYGGSLADAGQAVGRSGDDGIDGIIKEDRLGLDVVYVQAKRWTNTVGRPDIQAFAGSLMGYGASKGVFITTSRFSGEAREYVRRIDKRIVLIDGEELAGYMIDYGVGVTEVASYSARRLDQDFFDEAV